jgi:uncharacterized protein YbjT (DUF2867 family)
VPRTTAPILVVGATGNVGGRVVERLHAELDALVMGAGVEWTILRPGMFASNKIGWWAEAVRRRLFIETVLLTAAKRAAREAPRRPRA